MPECSLVPKILFLVSLLFVALLNPKFNPYLPFKFLIFYHSSIYIYIYIYILHVNQYTITNYILYKYICILTFHSVLQHGSHLLLHFIVIIILIIIIINCYSYSNSSRIMYKLVCSTHHVSQFNTYVCCLKCDEPK